MAEAVMAMYYAPDEEVKKNAETESSRIARDLAATCSEWRPDQAATLATTATEEAYTALHRALIG
jgi:hypothetical protein